MRAASGTIRTAWAALFALLLALRLVGGIGYMPGVEHGRATFVACPDAAPDAPLSLNAPMHHHGQGKHEHGTCPYAAAAALGALDPAFAPLTAILAIAFALILGRAVAFPPRQARRDRPPAIGPPATA